MAYRPTWFSENDIKEMIENWEIQDFTYQLENIIFNKQGYDLVLHKNEIKLVWEKNKNLSAEFNKCFLLNNLKTDNIEGHYKDFNVKDFFTKSKGFDFEIIQQFYWLNKDVRIKHFDESHIRFENIDNDKWYNLLNDAYEIFWVVTKDSFPEHLIKELEKLEEEKINDIYNKMSKLKDPRFKKEFEEVNNEIISEEKNISLEEKIKIISILTEKRLIEFGQYMRKKIKKELKKFKIVRWEEKQIKAIISKNIWSFFAKAGAELCTAWDKKMWNEERHIHLNLIDENKNQIVWNIMLYFEENRDYLIVRWFNPIKEIVNNYDNKTLVNEMIKVVKQIAKENWFEKVYIPKVSWTWHNLSNRDKIQKLVWNKSLENIYEENYLIKNAEYYQTSIWDYKIDELYLL